MLMRNKTRNVHKIPNNTRQNIYAGWLLAQHITVYQDL